MFECLNDSVLLEWHTPLAPGALPEHGGDVYVYGATGFGTFKVSRIRNESGNCVLSKTLEFVAKQQYSNYVFQCGVGEKGHESEKIWSKSAVLIGKSVYYIIITHEKET